MSALRTAMFVVVAVCVAACAGSTRADDPPPSAPAGGAVVTADGSAFDRDRLDVPADRPFVLLFENRESLQHNVTILDAATGATPFVGEIFGGPASREYQVPALAAGTYAFRCDVHPDMSGTLVAG